MCSKMIYGIYAQVYINFEGDMNDLIREIQKRLDLKYDLTSMDSSNDNLFIEMILGLEIKIQEMEESCYKDGYRYKLQMKSIDMPVGMEKNLHDISTWFARYLSISYRLKTMSEEIGKDGTIKKYFFWHVKETWKPYCEVIEISDNTAEGSIVKKVPVDVLVLEYYAARSRVYIDYEGSLETLCEVMQKTLQFKDLLFKSDHDEPYELSGYGDGAGMELVIGERDRDKDRKDYHFEIRMVSTDSLEPMMAHRMHDISLWFARYLASFGKFNTMVEIKEGEKIKKYFFWKEKDQRRHKVIEE